MNIRQPCRLLRTSRSLGPRRWESLSSSAVTCGPPTSSPIQNGQLST